MENTNATTPATPEVAGYDQEGAAQALLARWGVKPDEPATDDTSESEVPEAESQTETTPEQAPTTPTTPPPPAEPVTTPAKPK